MLGIASCTWSPIDQPLIIVLAVDQLGFEQIPCPEEELDHSGIALICKESVRFTHAFTTSTSSQSAMTSVLTGQWPTEHQVRSHGTDYLKPEIETVAEKAWQRNWRTAFFSGGAPILRRSGLHQGFELFEDNISFKNGFHLRPFEDSASLFKKWIKEDQKSATLSVFYVPDLLFADRVTTNHLSDQRNRSFQSQIEEFDESLYEFVVYLKNEKLWDRSYFFLVGLNGHIPDENPYTELRSRTTQVAMFAKGPTKPRDSGLSWTIDDNVSLVDLGFTIQNIVEKSQVEKGLEKRAAPAISILSVIEKPSPVPLSDRAFAVESSWDYSQNSENVIRASARQEHLIYLLEENPKIYNSLIDRLENYSLSTSDPVYGSFAQNSQSFLEKLKYKKFDQMKSAERPKLITKCLDSYMASGSQIKEALSNCDNKLVTDFFRLLESVQKPNNNEEVDLERRKFIIALKHHINDRRTRQLNEKIYSPWYVNPLDQLKELEDIISNYNDREAKKLLLQLLAST